jgi:hypothetical protein
MTAAVFILWGLKPEEKADETPGKIGRIVRGKER